MHDIGPNDASLFILVGTRTIEGVPSLLNMPVPKIFPGCAVIT
jgi:hypothetical protein